MVGSLAEEVEEILMLFANVLKTSKMSYWRQRCFTLQHWRTLNWLVENDVSLLNCVALIEKHCFAGRQNCSE